MVTETVPQDILRNHFKIDPESAKNPWTLPKQAIIPGSKDWGITYQLNGTKVSLAAVDALGMLLMLAKKINGILSLVQENIPATGLYFDSSVKFLDGVIGFEWGWKEHSDHRVFPWMAITANVNLISVAIELGFGVKAGVACRLQVFLKIAGSISVGVSAERSSPECIDTFKVPGNAKIDGSLGARFQAFAVVKLEASGTTGLDFSGISLAFSTTKGFSFEITKLTWTGIKVSVSVSMGVSNLGGEKSKKLTTDLGGASHEWVGLPAKVLFEGFKCPKKEEYTPQYATSSRIQEIVATVFEKKEPLRICQIENNRAVDLPMPDVAAEVYKNLDRIKNLDRSEKCIEAVSHKIRDILSLSAQLLGTNQVFAVERGAFVKYCTSQEFRNMCSHAQDTYLQGKEILSNPS